MQTDREYLIIEWCSSSFWLMMKQIILFPVLWTLYECVVYLYSYTNELDRNFFDSMFTSHKTLNECSHNSRYTSSCLV